MANIIQIKNLSNVVIAEIAEDEATLLIEGKDLLPKDVVAILKQVAEINSDLPKYIRSKSVSRLIFRDCKKAVGKMPSPRANLNSNDPGITEMLFEGSSETLEILRVISELNSLAMITGAIVGLGRLSIQTGWLASLHKIGIHCGKLENPDWEALEKLKKNLFSFDITGSDIETTDLPKVQQFITNSSIVRLMVKGDDLLGADSQQVLIDALVQNSQGNETKFFKVEDKEKPYPVRIVTDLEGKAEFLLPQIDGSTLLIDLLAKTLDLSAYKFPDPSTKKGDPYKIAINLLKKANPDLLIIMNDSFPVKIREVLGSCLLGSNVSEIRLSFIDPNRSRNEAHDMCFFLSHGYPRLQKLCLREVNLSGGDVRDGLYKGPNIGWLVNGQPEPNIPGISLEILELANCGIGDVDIANSDPASPALTHVVPSGSIRQLNLSYNLGITDNSLLSLMRWVANSNIAELNLNGTGISEAGKEEVAQLLSVRQGIPDPYTLMARASSFLNKELARSGASKVRG